MPPTVGGVVDAFKNLIRHGKHHRQSRPDPDEDQISPSSPVGFHLQQQQARKHQPIVSREVAEIIVNQEREEKTKLPIYPGLENFDIIEKMGEGAFSNVYNALDTKTNKKVAVKVVRKFELNSSQAHDKHLNPKFKKKSRVTERANILKEVQIMQGINHPSIVKLLSFSESPEQYFLVLELMDGGELFHQIVKLTYFSENLARHVILQVANGIRYLHEERGVVHRDIKPENLLFQRIPITPSKFLVRRQYDEDKEDEGEFIPGVGGGGIGRIKIADFGLSKVVWNEETMTPCGTVGYTAPEIVKDERYSKSVDMWALGCVLYTLLCGFPPFYDESINVLTEKVAKGHYTFLSPWWDEISLLSKDLIQQLLCIDPARRLSIDGFLAHPWCNAAPAPPPLPTPHAYNNAGPIYPLDSPLLMAARGGRAEGRSPGIATLKEAFDITYAVHRMEEEGARRRKYNGAQRFLSELNEDDEGDEGEAEDELPRAGTVKFSEARERSPVVNWDGEGGRAGQRDRGGGNRERKLGGTAMAGHGQHGTFELDLHGATLLGRRHKHAAQSSLRAEAPLVVATGGMRINDG